MSYQERLAATKARLREQRKTGKYNTTKFDVNTERVAPKLVGKQAEVHVEENVGGPVRERSTAARAPPSDATLNAPVSTTAASTPPPTTAPASTLPTPNVVSSRAKPKRKRATVHSLLREERKVKGGRARSYAAFRRKLELQRR